MLHRSRNSERDFWWNQLPCGPVLTPISCTKFKIHSTYEDSPIVPKQVFFSLVLAIWNVGPVNASQIKKVRKRFLVEPAPLLASSYTHLLYKAQDPFSHEDSAGSDTSSYFSPFLWDQVYASQIKTLRKRFFGGTSSLVGQFLHPSPVQSSRSILHMKTVQLFLNKFSSLALTIWNVGPVNASQIKKLRKRF